MGKINNLKIQLQRLTNELQKCQTEKESKRIEALNVNEKYFSDADADLLRLRENIDISEESEAYSDILQPTMTDDESWKTYEPILTLNQTTLPDRIKVGFWFTEDDDNFRIPAYIPFFKNQRTIIIKVNNEWQEKGHKLLNTLISRIYSLIPHYCQFTLFDPITNGAVFPVQRDVVTRQQDADMYHTLEAIIADMRRINSISALTEEENFSSKVESITMNEKFEFVCAANFPKGYDSRCIEKMNNIGNSGHVSGKYLIIVHNIDEPLPRDVSMDEFKNAIIINLCKYDEFNTINTEGIKIEYHEDEPASSEQWRNIYDKLTQFKPKERKITWDEYIKVDDSEMWSSSSAECIETNVGDVGGKPLNVWLGKKDSNNCAHGMLAATTGAGKSNMYHALILGLATRYSPEELRMYLIDGKNGVEFEVYRNFPHSEVVSLKSSSELTMSVLKELVDEVVRRNEFFKTQGVNSFDEYRKNPANKMPRILLLIDEYQVLFEGKEAPLASDYLRTLSAQARSAGIHMILGSQRFSVPNMQNKDAIFGNIQLRIAMKMTQDDRIALTEFGKEGKEFIRSCDLPGQIVINQNSGSDGSNQLGKVAYIGINERTSIIKDIFDKANAKNIDNRLMRTIVFEGDSAPNLDENGQLVHLASTKPMTPSDLQKLARKEERDGGYSRPDWNVSEAPMIGWIGQEFNVYGQASIVTRRRKMENILIVGDRNASRYGMILSTVVSFAVNGAKNDISFYVFDRSTIGTDWNPYLGRFCNEVLIPAGYNTLFANKVKDIKQHLIDVNKILTERLSLDQDERLDLKPIVVVITEPEDIEDLNLVIDRNGFKVDSEMGEILYNLYANGSQAGVHVILSSSGVVALSNVLQKKQLTYFRHRVSLQVSEQESYDFVQSRIASTLQAHGEVPTVAYYADINGSLKVKFKPYSINDEGFEEQFEHLKKLILRR